MLGLFFVGEHPEPWTIRFVWTGSDFELAGDAADGVWGEEILASGL